MTGNSPLHIARRQKRDEFYTQLPDIENELRHYREHFRGKVVYCNCDDPYESNFFQYFANNFNALGLKKLIATGYKDSAIQGGQIPLSEIKGLPTGRAWPYKSVVQGLTDVDGDGAVGLSDVAHLFRYDTYTTEYLRDDGDFRSAESIELLKEADIVVTNPPFSIFTEYLAQLIEHQKRFIIIGPWNAVTYKDVFPLFMDNRFWLGYGFQAGNAFFSVPSDMIEYAAGVYDPKTGLVKFRNVTWFTNLDHNKRHEELILVQKYTPEEYPQYDNYDAINIDRTQDIPVDYDGAMGVPITFLDKYNPDQFEIVDANDIRLNESVPFKAHGLIKDKESAIDGKPKYVRIVIRRR